MKDNTRNGLSGIFAEILFALLVIGIGLLIAWISWMVSL